MSKEETPITADKYFDNINWNMLLNECENPLDELKKRANLYAQAKVLEALTNKELQCSKECELVKCQDLHDKNKELQKENKHLKQVYEHRCNEVKDKVETIHNYLKQLQAEKQKNVELRKVVQKEVDFIGLNFEVHAVGESLDRLDEFLKKEI